ncbi:MAG: tetratricopeptide repeat protein [Pseudomonadota bacterium]
MDSSHSHVITKRKWRALLSLAQSGNAEAQWEIGYCHEFGAVDKSVTVLASVDLLEAKRWYERSAALGYSAAQGALSTLLSSGEATSRDYAGAIYWAKKAIAQGDASAAHNLGTIYRDQKKPAMAFRCYQRAVSMGANDSLLQVGLCYLFGFGTKQNFAEAQRCLEQLIASGAATICQRSKEDALYWMAILSLVGIGGKKKSIGHVRHMLESANADDDHEQANEILNILGKSKYLSA